MVLVTDEQAEEIQRTLAGGVRGGPVRIKWLELLLEDRAQPAAPSRRPLANS